MLILFLSNDDETLKSHSVIQQKKFDKIMHLAVSYPQSSKKYFQFFRAQLNFPKMIRKFSLRK